MFIMQAFHKYNHLLEAEVENSGLLISITKRSPPSDISNDTYRRLLGSTSILTQVQVQAEVKLSDQDMAIGSGPVKAYREIDGDALHSQLLDESNTLLLLHGEDAAEPKYTQSRC